jgi:hypothetical protein
MAADEGNWAGALGRLPLLGTVSRAVTTADDPLRRGASSGRAEPGDDPTEGDAGSDAGERGVDPVPADAAQVDQT